VPVSELIGKDRYIVIKAYLTSKIAGDRYPLLLRGSLLITAGSLIAILETFIAIYLGLHMVTYKQAMLVSVFVLFMSAFLVSIAYFKKNLLVWHEWIVFGIYLVFYQIGFSFWVFRLGEMRILAIINALTSIIILLSYTNIVQSFLISMFVLINYTVVTWYSIEFAGQPGSMIKETFFSFCLLPSFLLISSAAYYISKKRKDLESARDELENLNYNLSEINNKLKKEQVLSRIEMDLAREIQGVIFPGKKPVTSDWDVAFITRPYGAVSGDFYDFYCRDNTLKGISLFDVSGHGVAPALITILAKPIIYSHFNRCEKQRLGTVIESANEELLDELEAVNIYITGLLLRMDGFMVEYVNAGHPDLLHFQSSSNKVRVIKDSTNLFKGRPLGISLTKKRYSSLKFNVKSGDFLIFYSDGLTESRNYTGEQFGINRLSDIILSYSGSSSAGILEHIMGSYIDFTGEIKAADDITIIVAGKV
jgi:sigma-B regulation protein RsbU (phosphoserine phosphatase)